MKQLAAIAICVLMFSAVGTAQVHLFSRMGKTAAPPAKKSAKTLSFPVRHPVKTAHGVFGFLF